MSLAFTSAINIGSREVPLIRSCKMSAVFYDILLAFPGIEKRMKRVRVQKGTVEVAVRLPESVPAGEALMVAWVRRPGRVHSKMPGDREVAAEGQMH